MSEIKTNKEVGKKIALGIAGNVDSGKSTLGGNLLYLTGGTSEYEQKKLEDLAVKMKDASFKFAYTMDKLKEERERGVTIKETVVEFATKNRQFIISDLPGHALFTKNFLVGSSQLDLALIVVDVSEGAVDQTKEHLRIVLGNGVKNIIIVVNKMDTDTINYSENAFRDVETKVTTLVASKVNYFKVIPLSAYTGENIIKNTKMPWYTGPTLYELLDTVPIPQLPIDKPLRVHVSEVVNIKGIGTIVQGKVSRGVLRTNQTIIVKPLNKRYDIKSIETFHKSVTEAYPNESVGICLKNLNKDDIKKGYVISELENQPYNTKSFTLDLTVINPDVTLREASDLLLSSGTNLVAVKIIKIKSIRDRMNTEIYNIETSDESSKKQTVVRGQSATIDVNSVKVIPLEIGAVNPKLGVCKLLNERGLVATAVVMHIIPETN